MSETLTVKVLQHHIDQGVGRDAHQCAIAQALTEAGYWASVTRDSAYVRPADASDDTPLTRYPLPQEARTFIVRFDSGYPVQPAAFDLTDGRKMPT